MAFKQYTKCTDKNDFSPENRPLVIVGGIVGLLGLITAIIVGALASMGVGAAIWYAGAVSGFLAIVAVFEYLLGGKLICLGGDKPASGKLMSVEPASQKPFPEDIDNDYSFNLLLHTHLDDDLADEANPMYQDELIFEQEASKMHGLPYLGYSGFEGRPILHCEIEGSRIHDMYQAFMATWAILVAMALLAMGLSTVPVIGWLLALLAMLLGVGIGAGITIGSWTGADDGSPSDLDPKFGKELEVGAHYFTIGTWTYDAGHNDDGEGWNEFHPVKYLQKIDDELTEDEFNDLTAMVDDARSTTVKEKQSLDSHQWELHPEVDGCEEEDEDPVIY